MNFFYKALHHPEDSGYMKNQSSGDNEENSHSNANTSTVLEYGSNELVISYSHQLRISRIQINLDLYLFTELANRFVNRLVQLISNEIAVLHTLEQIINEILN